MMVPLPPYARRIEYLESDGAAYIDTGIDAQSELGIKTEIYALRPEASSVGAVFGARTAYHENSLLVWIGLAGDVQRMRFDYANSEQHVDNDDSNFSIVLNNNRGTINGISLDHTAASFNSHIPIHIFGLNNNGTHGAMLSAIKVKTFSISLNGTPVRSFVPCRVLDTGYLWDEVNGVMYGNQGTGDFVLGPDVREGVLPTRLNPFGVGRRMEKIRRVEYLESTGTQWIDTGVAAADPSTLKTEIDCFGNICCGFTHQRAGSGTWLGISNNSSWSKDYNSRYNMGTSSRRQVFTWDGATGIYVDGAMRHGFTASNGTDNVVGISWPLFFVYDFNAVGYEAGVPKTGRVYSTRFWISGTLVRDFVPVAIGSTGFLWDRVSGRLFGNRGTGDFVVGPDNGTTSTTAMTITESTD